MNYIILLLTLSTSMIVHAKPAVGDKAIFKATSSSEVRNFIWTIEYSSFDPDTNNFNQIIKIIRPEHTTTRESKISLDSALNLSTETMRFVVENCELLNSKTTSARRVDTVTPAGTFDTCEVSQLNLGIKYVSYYAEVPFGIVKRTIDTETSELIEFQSADEGI